MNLNFFGAASVEAPAPVIEYKSINDMPAVVEVAGRLATLVFVKDAAEIKLRDVRMQKNRGRSEVMWADYGKEVQSCQEEVWIATRAVNQAMMEMTAVRDQAKADAAARIWPAYETALQELESALAIAQAKNDRVAEIYEEASGYLGGGTLSNPVPNLCFTPLNRSSKGIESKLEWWARNVRSYFTSWVDRAA